MRYRRLLVRVLSVLLTTATAAWATEGHQLIGVGATQKATAGAGVASPKDATWVLLNPAGIATLERRVDAGLELFMPSRSIEARGPGLGMLGGNPLANIGAGRSADHSMFVIPSCGLVLPLETGTFGVGIYGVSGMGVNYTRSRTTVAAGQRYDRRTEYAVGKLATAYAYPLGEGLFIGGALNLDITRFRSDMLTPAFRQTKGDYAWDTAYGAGFQIGILKQAGDWSFGGTYISRQWFEELEAYDDLLRAPLDLPQMVQAGVAWDANERLELLLDYKFIDWSAIKQLGEAPIDGGFGWDDQHVVKLGAVWQMSERLRLSGGYSYGNSPIDENVVFANSLFPAVVEHHFTIGLGADISESASVQLTYMYVPKNRLTDNGTGDFYSQAGAGTNIELGEHAFLVQYGFKF